MVATMRAYAVLARVSPSYSSLSGRSSTCYAPVRRFTRLPKEAFSLDLHVLSTPPAFILSQDQTLQFEPSIRTESRSARCGITEYDSPHPRTQRITQNKELTLVLTVSIQFSKNRLIPAPQGGRPSTIRNWPVSVNRPKCASPGGPSASHSPDRLRVPLQPRADER